MCLRKLEKRGEKSKFGLKKVRILKKIRIEKKSDCKKIRIEKKNRKIVFTKIKEKKNQNSDYKIWIEKSSD